MASHLTHSEHKPRIFVSSRITGLEALRAAAADAIESLNLDPWVFERKPGSSQPLEESYRDYATRSLRLIWIATAETSDATREEVTDAQRLRIPVLVFVIEEPNDDTQALLDTIDNKRIQNLNPEAVPEAVRVTLEDELWRGLRPPGGQGGAGPPPPPLADFSGREAEVETVRREIQKGSVVVVSGMPGVGKSVLVHTAAHHGWAELVLFLDLRLATRPARTEDSLRRLLLGMGVDAGELPAEEDELRARWLAETKERRALVIVDDAASESEVRDLLPAGEGAALITARKDLAGLEGVTRVPLGTLAAEESRTFLEIVLGPERIGTETEAGAVERLHELTGGLPLALRITAARLATRPQWSLQDYASRLENEHERLGNLEAGDLAVRASFNLSFSLLSDTEANTFRAIGYLRSPVLAAEVISAALGRNAESALESIVTAQLLTSRAPGMYEIHDLLRLFAKERLEDLAEAAQRMQLSNLASHYTQAALTRSEAIVKSQPLEGDEAPLVWLDREAENLQAVAEQLEEHEEWGQLGALVLSSGGLYSTAGRWRQWQPFLRLGQRAGTELGSGEIQSKVTLNLGICAENLGDGDRAKKFLEEAIEIATEAKEPSVEAGALAHLGTLKKKAGEAEAAMELTRRALEIYRQSDNELGEAKALGDLANQLDDLGRLDEAIERHREAIAALIHLGDRGALAREHGNLAVALQRSRRFEEADTEYRRSEAIWEELGARFSVAATRRRRAEVALSAGDNEVALDLVETAIEDLDPLDARADLAAALAVRGVAKSELGQEGGQADIDSALALYREHDAEIGAAVELMNLSSRLSPPGAGVPLLMEQARQAFLRNPGPAVPGHANAAQLLATLAVIQGRLDDAHELLIETATLAKELSPPPDKRHALALLNLARFRAQIGLETDARVALEEARALDVDLDPEQFDSIQQILAANVEVTGAGELTQRIRRGSSMALSDLDWIVGDLNIVVSQTVDGPPDATWSINEGEIGLSIGFVRSRIEPSDVRLWMLLYDLVARHILLRMGVEARHPLGAVLLGAGGWWFTQTTVAAGQALPLPAPKFLREDPTALGAYLGAAIAGDNAALEVLQAEGHADLLNGFRSAREEWPILPAAEVLQWIASYWHDFQNTTNGEAQ